MNKFNFFLILHTQNVECHEWTEIMAKTLKTMFPFDVGHNNALSSGYGPTRIWGPHQ